MPNRRELSRAYKAGYDCGVSGANTSNCHFSYFASREATKTWEAGIHDAIEKLLVLQTENDKKGQHK